LIISSEANETNTIVLYSTEPKNHDEKNSNINIKVNYGNIRRERFEIHTIENQEEIDEERLTQLVKEEEKE
jgi:hypothetical protein